MSFLLLQRKCYEPCADFARVFVCVYEGCCCCCCCKVHSPAHSTHSDLPPTLSLGKSISLYLFNFLSFGWLFALRQIMFWLLSTKHVCLIFLDKDFLRWNGWISDGWIDDCRGWMIDWKNVRQNVWLIAFLSDWLSHWLCFSCLQAPYWWKSTHTSPYMHEIASHVSAICPPKSPGNFRWAVNKPRSKE